MTLTMTRVKVGNSPVLGKYINLSSNKEYENVAELLFPGGCIVLDKCCVGAARGDI